MSALSRLKSVTPTPISDTDDIGRLIIPCDDCDGEGELELTVCAKTIGYEGCAACGGHGFTIDGAPTRHARGEGMKVATCYECFADCYAARAIVVEYAGTRDEHFCSGLCVLERLLGGAGAADDVLGAVDAVVAASLAAHSKEAVP